MVNKCIALNCDYNYDSERKRRKLLTEYEKISIFAFPKHKENPEKRVKWIAKVPRENWHPKNESKLFICEKHFQENDIVATSTDSNNRHKQKKQSEVLGHKRLKEDTVPCIWLGSPHLSKNYFPSSHHVCVK